MQSPVFGVPRAGQDMARRDEAGQRAHAATAPPSESSDGSERADNNLPPVHQGVRVGMKGLRLYRNVRHWPDIFSRST